MDKIEKIRQEIERRRDICKAVFERESDTYYQGKAVAYDETLSFLDTLQEEPDKSLEEAAKKYATEWHKNPDGSAWKPYFEVSAIKAFIAGAEWQKEQMMRGAIHYVVQDDLDSHGASYNIPFIRIGINALKPKGIGVGDKVKLIVIKEED